MDAGLSLLLVLPMLLVMAFVYFVIFHRKDLKCPHCHAKIEGTGHSSFVRLGAPLLSCPFCGREFFDPFRMEWAAHAVWYRILSWAFQSPCFFVAMPVAVTAALLTGQYSLLFIVTPALIFIFIFHNDLSDFLLISPVFCCMIVYRGERRCPDILRNYAICSPALHSWTTTL